MAGTSQRSMYVADCPRCGHAKTTFDIFADVYTHSANSRDHFECFLKCRSCGKPSVGHLRQKSLGDHKPTGGPGNYQNSAFAFESWVFEIPGSRSVPEHVPDAIAKIFKEGADCVAIGAYDAAGAMFRKVLDAATREMTPTPDSSDTLKPPNWKAYKDLRLRLDWLFTHGRLNPSLENLSSCIHQDGNDAAHDLAGIGKEEAEDLSDFVDQVLRVIYTIPGQIAENEQRRLKRRGTDVAKAAE
jgi:hypothetical protein